MINFHERYVTPYNEIYDKLTSLFTIPELTKEENLLQFYNVPSEPTVTEDSLKRKRTEDNEDKSTNRRQRIDRLFVDSSSLSSVLFLFRESSVIVGSRGTL